jgi:hypothetical protein
MMPLVSSVLETAPPSPLWVTHALIAHTRVSDGSYPCLSADCSADSEKIQHYSTKHPHCFTQTIRYSRDFWNVYIQAMGRQVTLQTYALTAKWTMQTTSILRTSNVLASVVVVIIIRSLWSIGHPWRASWHYDLQLSAWLHSMISISCQRGRLLYQAVYPSFHFL